MINEGLTLLAVELVSDVRGHELQQTFPENLCPLILEHGREKHEIRFQVIKNRLQLAD
ncbi:hypothetical protein D3C85_1732760 [compost metagenome]